MADILAEICAHKRQEVNDRKSRRAEPEVRAAVAAADPVRGFTKALLAGRNKGYGLIAEIKRPRRRKGSFVLILIPRPWPKRTAMAAHLAYRC